MVHVELLALLAGDDLPATHDEHADDSDEVAAFTRYLPALQLEHEAEVEPLYLPVAQVVQDSADAALNSPASQIAHDDDSDDVAAFKRCLPAPQT